MKPGKGGIIETARPKYSSIQQIKDAQAKQTKQLEDLREKQWGDLSTGTDEIQIINTQNVQKAKQGLVDLDNELTCCRFVVGYPIVYRISCVLPHVLYKDPALL